MSSEDRPGRPSSDSLTSAKTVQDKFRARFVEAATKRRQAIVQALEKDKVTGFAIALREFHALGGEAAMLAMTSIAAVCREGEDASRCGDGPAVAKVLEQLEIAIFAEEPSRGAP